MQNRFFTVLIFLFASTSLFTAEMQKRVRLVTPSLEVRNLAVFLDGSSVKDYGGEGDWLLRDGKMPPLMRIVTEAVQRKSPLILHSLYVDILLQRGTSTALASFRHEEYEKQTRSYLTILLGALREGYRIKVNPEGTFIVGLPRKNYEATAFDVLGFDTSRLKDWKDDTQIASGASLDVAHFKALFNKDRSIPTRIYATGHSNIGSLMCMRAKQYKEYLQTLEAINTQFLFIWTCHFGGMNAVKMNKGMTKFPIVSGSTNDGCPPDHLHWFAEFFQGLDAYCAKPHDEQALKRLLWEFYGKGYHPNNIPIFRPAGKSIFRAVEISPCIESITMETVPGIQEVETVKGGGKSVDRLLYPAVVDIPLCNEEGIRWHSMIGGNALHVLSAVKTPVSSENQLPHAALWRAFKAFQMDEQPSLLTKWTCSNVFYKTFVIRLLQSCNTKTERVEDVYESVVISIPDRTKELVARVLHCTNKPELTYAWLHLQEGNDRINIISQSTALAKMKQMITNAQPDPEALNYATDGQQNERTLRDALPDELQAKNNDMCVIS